MTQNPGHAEPNYFTCTLGQAALVNKRRPQSAATINDIIDEYARTNPEAKAVGFPVIGQSPEDPWDSCVLSFQELKEKSLRVANQLPHSFGVKPGQKSQPVPVAILASSSFDFLLYWLALTRIGRPCLQIAPQCQPPAIVHLCKTLNITVLVHDAEHRQLAQSSLDLAQQTSDGWHMDLMTLPLVRNLTSFDSYVTQTSLGRPTEDQPRLETFSWWPVREDDVAYIHHSSGTSSGLPKPVPQTHHNAAATLPHFRDGSSSASFTTTPLYHGGVVDCLRAWASGAMIWLFPGGDLPITATNILRSFDCADVAQTKKSCPPIKYFSSVPFVLQMMAAEQAGLRLLQRMDIVGVGGAALPVVIGDMLVQRGVNLISRFGNVECGFLLNSYRDFGYDKEWQYLRSDHGAEWLTFEPQDDGTSELIVTAKWPQLNKHNRPDGSFATADLFAPHPTIPEAWKYHSRADSQLTLVTGKKFDPAPLEGAIASSCLVDDVMIFGNGRNYPGALIFPSTSSELSPEAYRVALWKVIEKINSESPAHARISPPMVQILDGAEPPLEKSSKGTILRKQAEIRFAQQIETAYGVVANAEISGGKPFIDEEALPAAVADIVNAVSGRDRHIARDLDLFAQGIDSVACIQIRGRLQAELLPTSSAPLPLNVVYDCGSIEGLTNFVRRARLGDSVAVEDETELMRSLVMQYSQWQRGQGGEDHGSSSQTSTTGTTVILTGATGALGANMLDQLVTDDRIESIICLVRAENDHAASERVQHSLLRRAKQVTPQTNKKVVCLAATLAVAQLGLSDEKFHELANVSSMIIHAAWAVNFSMRLRSFTEHIQGLYNLIDLALSDCDRKTPPILLFCSSTASVLGPSAKYPIAEEISRDPTSASPLGYSRSKWVAEAICQKAHEDTHLRNRIGILRIGQLTGDTKDGIWNATEAWPMMLSSMRVTGALPDLQEPLSWLPLDIAAEAVIQAGFWLRQRNLNDPSKTPSNDPHASIPILHLVNNDRSRTWQDLLGWMEKLESSYEVLPQKAWVARLESLEGSLAKHPATKLIGLWRDAYGSDTSDVSPTIDFSMDQTIEMIPSMQSIRAVDEDHFRLIHKWMKRDGLL